MTTSPDHSPPDHRKRTSRILVVDDEKSIRLTVSAFLRGEGYEVETAADADQAVAVLGQAEVDVVVCDIILPGLNGVELLQTIRDADPRVQVIMMTGEPTVETSVEALRAGAYDYLSKPVAKEAIIKVVRQAAQLKESEEERVRLLQENRRYQQELEARYDQRTAELDQSQEQLQQAQKMEAVGRLAGGVAHDFNNILTVIIGCGDMAQGDLAADHPARAFLREILNAADRGADITRQLLAFCRHQVARPTVLDLNETVEGMTKMLRRLIGEDVELSFDAADELWPVLMDPSQLNQILANLCVNARDAIGGVGSITITADNFVLESTEGVEPDTAEPGDYVRLQVRDTGCGMDSAVRARIFDPFYTTKDEGKGTGLGLSTVYGVVTQSNGFIQVESEPGAGTTFTIGFPRGRGQPQRHSSRTKTEIPRGNGETVLAVDDDLAVLNVVNLSLSKLGYNVLTAHTPTEALRVADEHAGAIDLLLADMVMPEMNGKELANRLQERYPGLKRVIMSGYTPDALADRGVLEETYHFLPKPLAMPGLATRVHEVLQERSGAEQEQGATAG